MTQESIVLIVEDDAQVRDVLAEIIRRDGLSVRTFASGEELLAADLSAVNCILLDMRLPAIQGLEVLEELKLRNSAVPVIVVTGYGDVGTAVRAMKAGAIDYLQKPVDGHALVAAVRDALRLGHERHTKLRLAHTAKEKISQLSEDERRVYRLLMAGNSNKQIAATLEIGLRTVELRRANLLKKMGADSLPDLVRLAILGGLSPDLPH